MIHRHLHHEIYTLAGIDDVIARGNPKDWVDMKLAAESDPSLWENIVRVCSSQCQDPYQQRHYFWMQYAKQHLT